jgi:hypothetical protein
LHFIYIDVADNTLKTSLTPWTFDQVQVALVAYDSLLSPAGLMYYETHGLMSWETHQELHQTIGTYRVSGGVVDDYVLQNSSDTNNNFSVTQCVIKDEDNQRTLTAKADNGPWTIFYKDGTAWTRTYVNSYTALISPSNYIYCNTITAGVGALVDVNATNRYVNYFLCASLAADPQAQFFLIPGQVNHSSLAAAQAENFPNLDLSGLPFAEFVPLQKFAYRTGSGYASTGRYRIEATAVILGTLVSQVNVAGSTSPSNHSNLTNRSDADSHPAAAISTSLTNFNGGLSTEDNVQSAFDRLDDFGFCGAWTTATAYRVGNIVSYNGELWRCTTANSDVSFTVGNWANLVNRYISDVLPPGASVNKTTTSSSQILLALSYGDVALLVSASKALAAVSALSDPSGVFLEADSGTGIYVSKSAGSADISIKNRTGGSITLISRFLTNVI